MKHHPVLLSQPSYEQVLARVEYRGKPSRIEPTLDFIKRQKSFGSVINYDGVTTWDNEPRACSYTGFIPSPATSFKKRFPDFQNRKPPEIPLSSNPTPWNFPVFQNSKPPENSVILTSTDFFWKSPMYF